jgi:hypothetical protein
LNAIFGYSQLYGRGVGKKIAGKLFNVLQKFSSYPVRNKPTWGIDQYLLGTNLNIKGLDPGVELLCVERSREVGEAMAPEFVHEQLGGS